MFKGRGPEADYNKELRDKQHCLAADHQESHFTHWLHEKRERNMEDNKNEQVALLGKCIWRHSRSTIDKVHFRVCLKSNVNV